MKKIFLIMAFMVYGIMCLTAQKDSDVLMTVGDAQVTVGEFKYIYEKNNGDKADYSKESLAEYLELYKKFKLKVQKAKAMKLDTIEALNEELNGYRKQLASSFLSDKEVLDQLVEEIHERKKWDIRVQHILLKVKENAPNEFKKQKEQKILDIKKELNNGKLFSELAGKYSEDKNSYKKEGELGYITAMLPSGFYNIENAIYNHENGDVVGPVWSKLGCHLLRIKKKRPARGEIKVAHLLLKEDRTNQKTLINNSDLADSIYTALQGGADWNALVEKYSSDKKTKKNGGELPIFGIATYETAFENAAFKLNEVGQISRPVKTKSGYHIIKLIEKIPFETKDDIKKRLKDRIKNYDRYKDAQKNLISRIKKTSNFQENRNELSQFIFKLDKDFYSYKWKPENATNGNTLLSFGDDTYTVVDFSNFCKKNTRMRSQFDKEKPLNESVEYMYGEFVKEKAISHEEKNLEKKYPSFKSLMREYEEGILLFEATKISVWDKANQDTLELHKFYEQNKGSYQFNERATIQTFFVNSADEKLVKKIAKCAKKKGAEKTMSKYNKEGKEIVSFQEMVVEPGSKELNGLNFKKNSVSKPIIDGIKKKSSFKKLVNIDPPRRKSLKEARGYVVADYQDKLEKDWVLQLKKEFEIIVNEPVYKMLVK